MEEKMDVSSETVVKELLNFNESDLLDEVSSESESSESEKPLITYQMRLQWQEQLAGITEEILRDVTAALVDLDGV